MLSIWSIHISYNDGGDNDDNDVAGGDINGDDNDCDMSDSRERVLPIKQNLEIHSSLVIYMEEES